MKSEMRTIGQFLSIRPAEPSDREFLEAVYATTRSDELAALGWDEMQIRTFLKMQFDFQTRSYEMQFPAAAVSIIEFDGTPAGRLVVNRSSEEIRLVDIALLPENRNRGIGTFLLKELQTEAATANTPLTLQVLVTNNQAVKLYERNDFVVVSQNDMYLGMEWRA